MAAVEMQTSKPRGKQIDVREAVRLATSYFTELFSAHQFNDLALEEVELSEDGNYWLITLGYYEPQERQRRPPLSPSLAGLLSHAGPVRRLKLFKVDARSGRVVSMKIRRLE